MPLAVVQGAELKCDKCPATSRLIVTTESSTDVERKPPATVQDHLPFKNVPPFPGKCAVLGIDCIPLTFLPWGTSFTGILLSLLSAEILGADDKLKCLVGGTISVTDPNQSTMTVDLAQAKEDLADALRARYMAEGPSDVGAEYEAYLRALAARLQDASGDAAVATTVAIRGGPYPGGLAATIAGLLAAAGGGSIYLAEAYQGDEAENAEEALDEAADRVREEQQDAPTAEEIIRGGSKGEMDSGLKHLTEAELKKLKGKGGRLGKRADKMLKLINQEKRLRAKARGGSKGRRPGRGGRR